MPRTFLSTEQILSMLAATPLSIAESTSRLSEIKLHAAPNPDEWSANDVLAHLRSCADVWGNCIMTMLKQDNPTIRAINPRTWIRSMNCPDQKFKISLQAFTVQRAGLLEILDTLKPKDWQRSGIVTGVGKPLKLTVHSYAERLAVHERPHVKQIKQIAAIMHNQF